MPWKASASTAYPQSGIKAPLSFLAHISHPRALVSQRWMNFQSVTWLHPSTWLSCLEWGPAKNELSWRQCAGKVEARKPGMEPTLPPPPEVMGSTAVPGLRSLQCQSGGCLLLYTPGKGSFCCYSPSFSLDSRPSVCLSFRHSEGYSRYPDGALPMGKEQFVLGIAFLFAFFFLAHFD